jgi:hypothetical protein
MTAIQDVMQVAHHYFENAMAYFTKRINRCISISTYFEVLAVDDTDHVNTMDLACANGEVAPFVGHNA